MCHAVQSLYSIRHAPCEQAKTPVMKATEKKRFGRVNWQIIQPWGHGVSFLVDAMFREALPPFSNQKLSTTFDSSPRPSKGCEDLSYGVSAKNEHRNSPRAGPYLLLPQSTAVQTKGCPIFKCSKTPKEAALPQRLRHKQQIRNAATLRLPGREQRRQLNRSKSTIKMCCRQINNEAG